MKEILTEGPKYLAPILLALMMLYAAVRSVIDGTRYERGIWPRVRYVLRLVIGIAAYGGLIAALMIPAVGGIFVCGFLLLVLYSVKFS